MAIRIPVLLVNGPHSRRLPGIAARVLMLASVLGLLAACGGINERQVGDSGLRFFVHGRTVGPSGGLDAQIVGLLAAADGCVLLEQDGIRFPVVWPSGTSVASTDPLVIELPSGAELALGERVVGGGGYLNAGDVGVNVPAECLNEHGEIAVFNRDDDPVVDAE